MRKAVIGLVALLAAVVLVGGALAAVVTVAPGDPSWHPTDQRGAGTVTFSSAYGAPAGLGSSALRFTTTTTADKADYMTFSVAGTPLSQVSKIGYSTYQHTANFPGGDASLQLQVDLNGGTVADGGFTTLVYEPYLQGGNNGGVVTDQWQHWDATNGQFWSSRTAGTLIAGGGGCPCYTLAQVVAGNPNAIVLGIGANVGSFNPGYDVGVDGIEFNDTTWNFEIPPPMPSTKDDCKNGGWESYGVFKNQGDCVSWVATGGK
jgi:hypothetical protein